MEIIKAIIGGIAAMNAVGGLMDAYSGWNQYIDGKKNEVAQQQDRGRDAMLYGALKVAGSAAVGTAIIVAIDAIKF